MIGLIMLVVLVALSVYALVAFPGDVAGTWNNPKNWEGNPASAPPGWISYFSPNYPPTVEFSSGSWTNVSPQGSALYNYSNKYSFQWSSTKTPSTVNFIPKFSGSLVEAAISWTKPDGNSFTMFISNPQSALQYGINDPAITPWVEQFISAQTGSPASSVTVPQEMSALFNKDGPKLMNNTVLQGTYNVRIDMVGTAPTTVLPATLFSLTGKSYGFFGTDLFGRPIEFGILLGLPWALELGAVTSVVAVIWGVVWGGIGGFVGGRRDTVLQWGALVALALPALPFLIVLSYSVNLDLISEALLIAALSWPFYAIIARSVSLSVKSQTYVEADKAMGISSIRTFFTHFMPRLTPVSIAYTALGVPAGILLAQTLAFLGIQPSTVVTWGGILDDAFLQQAALFGWWWWVLFPGLMIVVASVPFVLIGFALDKIVAPRVSAK
jgi:peptide/nickel transport system permease protein